MGVAGLAVAHGFVADTLLLAVERERDERGRQQVGDGTRKVVECARANPETNVAESKLRGTRSAKVFAWTKEEKETGNQTVGRCARMGSIVEGSEAADLGDERERKGLDPGRRIVDRQPGTIQGG